MIMKTSQNLRILLAVSIAALMLSGCEYDVSVTTAVGEDGSLEKSIGFQSSDSAKIKHNNFGISASKGWDVFIQPSAEQEGDKESNLEITFRKKFASAGEANRELDQPSDTLFRIASDFRRVNRWFHTYIEYQETYRALNNFRALPVESYLTQEDMAFIRRLPPEGVQLSKADSLFMIKLNEKVFDIYGANTVFAELYDDLVSTVKEYSVPHSAMDSIAKHREALFSDVVGDGSFKIELLDKYGIILPAEARRKVERKLEEIDRKATFISESYSGRYMHSITLPWNISESNADHVEGRQAYWGITPMKFLLTDFTMTATARRINYWAVALLGALVCTTAALFIARARWQR